MLSFSAALQLEISWDKLSFWSQESSTACTHVVVNKNTERTSDTKTIVLIYLPFQPEAKG
jgi:hypothetical protein